jgi:hypothetical protein
VRCADWGDDFNFDFDPGLSVERRLKTAQRISRVLSPDRSFHHRITDNAVDLEVQRIEAALKQADCDPFGFDLGGLARHRLVEEAVGDLRQHGVDVKQKHWMALHDGGVDLAIEVTSTADFVFAKLMLG